MPETSISEDSQFVPGSYLNVADVVLSRAERFIFASLVILIPFRLRTVLQPVPIPPIYGDYTDVLLFASDAALLLLLGLWLARLGLQRRKIESGPWFITWPLAGLLISGLLSTVTSVAPSISAYHLLRLVVLFAFYLYIVNELRSASQLVLPAALQIGVQGAVAAAQFITQHSIGLERIGELTLDPSWFGVSIVWAPDRLALRGYGLSDHPNILGGCLALGVLFLLFTRREVSSRFRMGLDFNIVLGLAGLLLTFSRAAWLGLAVGVVAAVGLLAYRKRSAEIGDLARFSAAAAIPLIPFLIAALPFISARFSLPIAQPGGPGTLISPEDRSIQERLALVEAANALFVERPLTGAGLGAFPVALLRAFPDFGHYYQPVHFVLLDVAAETGLAGGLAYFLAAGLPWAALWLNRRRLLFSPGLIAAHAMLSAVTVIGLFDYYPWFLQPGRLWHWLVWGLWAAAFHSDSRANG